VNSHTSPAAGGRLVLKACSSMILWAGLMTAAFIVLTRLLAIGSSRQDIELANNLLPIVPASLVVILAYLVWRLLPMRRILGALGRGEKAEHSDFENATRQAMMLPRFFVVGAVAVSVCVSASMVLAGGLAETRAVNVVARLLSIGQALIVVYGMGSYLMLRVQLRPVLEALRPHSVPMRRRFGLRWRLMLWVLLLAATGVTTILVVDSQATGRLLLEAGGVAPGAAGSSGEWPLLSGYALVAMVLVLLFASSIGWQLGVATSQPALAMIRHLESMATHKSAAAVERLPVYSATEVGRIAVAFNRLADRLDVEHARLDAYATQIRQTEQLRSRFLANVSHELRTPLNAVIGFSDVLLQGFDGELNQRQQEAVRIINREGERFLNLINDILLMARFEAGRVVPLQEDVNLYQVLLEALSSVPSLGPDKLEREEDPRLKRFSLRGDRRQLLRAVTALIRHTVRTAGDSRVHLEVEIEPGNVASLRALSPSAPPPEPEERERIFEGFRCVGGREGSGRGVGLGLPLARRIAEAHGGEVTFVDRQGACGLQISLPGALIAEEDADDPV
jgi:signal transduction histidine kinase